MLTTSILIALIIFIMAKILLHIVNYMYPPCDTLEFLNDIDDDQIESLNTMSDPTPPIHANTSRIENIRRSDDVEDYIDDNGIIQTRFNVEMEGMLADNREKNMGRPSREYFNFERDGYTSM